MVNHRTECWIDRLRLQASKRIIGSPVATLGDHKKDPLEGQLWSVHVLQYDRARTVPAVTCKLVKTRVFAYCGSFYHSKAHELEMSWSKRELVTICWHLDLFLSTGKIQPIWMTEMKCFGTDQREYSTVVLAEHQLILERQGNLIFPKFVITSPRCITLITIR